MLKKYNNKITSVYKISIMDSIIVGTTTKMLYVNSLYALTQNWKATWKYPLPKGGVHSQMYPSNLLQALSIICFKHKLDSLNTCSCSTLHVCFSPNSYNDS